MPLSNDVNLPKTRRPVFPDRCVACGAAGPGDTIRVGTNAIGWWTLAFWVPGRRFAVDVPACPPCARHLRRQRLLRLVVGGAVAVAGAVVAVALLQWYRGPMRRWLAMGITLVCMLPYILWETFSPPPFGLTAFAETVDYEFRDAGYAAEFAALNGAAVE
jgi:hypothetical protein